MTARADEIELQADLHRNNVAELIEELRTKLTAGQILDQVLGTSTLTDMGRNLGTQAKNNPMALALVGGGLAWLMMSDSKPQPYSYQSASRSPSTSQSVGQAGEEMADTAKDKLQSVGDKASAAMDGAGEAWDKTKSQGAKAWESIADKGASIGAKAEAYAGRAKAAANDTGADIAARASSFLKNSKPGARLEQLSREQPLLLAGIGVALGMLLGAGLPLSQVENELLGEQSDRLRGEAREMAREGVTRTREAAGAAYDAAVDTLSSGEEEQDIIDAAYKPDSGSEPARYHH